MRLAILGGMSLLFLGISALFLDSRLNERARAKGSLSMLAADNRESSRLRIDAINSAKGVDALLQFKSEGQAWLFAMAYAKFQEADATLAHAARMSESLTLPSKTVLEHPLVISRYREAMSGYREAKELIDKVKETRGDTEFNFKLSFLRGNIYFRYLEYLSSKETSGELFELTLASWKAALRYKPRDIDTVINIEILVKSQSSLMSGAPKIGGSQGLPNLKAGGGKAKGI